MKTKILISTCLLSAVCLQAQIFEVNTSFPEVGGNSRSANWVDLNYDGDLDVFFSNGPASGDNNQAYLGMGDGNFIPYDPFSPLVLDDAPSVGACFAQANIFPGLDVFVATWYGERNDYYSWAGDIYQHIEIAPPANLMTYSETGAFGDADQNGLLELYVTNSAGQNDHNLYYSATQLGAFAQLPGGVHVEDQGASRGVTWIDYDNDGDADLFVTNEDNTPNRLYQNQGDGTFLSIQDGVIATNAGSTMSATWGDYNNDGYMDLFICNYDSNNMLYKNGPDGFVEVPESIVSNDDGFSFSANWGDIDNDGDLDLFVSNAFHTDLNSPLQNFLYLNNGDETFTKIETDVVTQNEGWTYGNAFGDFEKDGDLDLITANCFQSNEPNRLYRNLTSDGEDTPNWLEVECQGTISNPSAIGTRVTVVAEINGEEVWQTREITSQSSYCGQNMFAAHFGLGDAAIVEQLIIDWPSSPTEVYTGINTIQYFIAVEGDGPLSVNDVPEEIPVLVFPNPANDYVQISLEAPASELLRLQLFDLQGKTVSDLGMIKPGVRTVRFPLPIVPEGLYIIRGEGEAAEFTRKIKISQ